MASCLSAALCCALLSVIVLAAGPVGAHGVGTLPGDAPGLPDPTLAGWESPAAQWLFDLGAISVGDDRMHAIYALGQTLGNDPHAFSKVGDCNSEVPYFLAGFDQGRYDLGAYGYLQPVIDYFDGSFARESLAVWTGNHVWALNDPTWANPAYCRASETPLECELRVNRPSFVLIRLGTNSARSPELFEGKMRAILDLLIERGVVPILGTKADRIEGSDRINDIIRALATEYGVPLWDFGRVADTIPGNGLRADGFHLTYAAPYYTSLRAMQSGHSVQNLTALVALHAIWLHIVAVG